MTIKKLSAEGRFECGIDDIMKGKVFAFVPVTSPGSRPSAPYALGAAVANEYGYNLIPLTWCHGDSWEEMRKHADELNAAMELDEIAAMKIVCSTMRPKHTYA